MPQAHTRHHRHLELAELVWPACLEVADVPYALTSRITCDHRVSQLAIAPGAGAGTTAANFQGSADMKQISIPRR
eukprot:COSAG02_NODE_3641_length_6437_cov_237.157936_3_plen_75_part_00